MGGCWPVLLLVGRVRGSPGGDSRAGRSATGGSLTRHFEMCVVEFAWEEGYYVVFAIVVVEGLLEKEVWYCVTPDLREVPAELEGRAGELWNLVERGQSEATCSVG